MSELILGIDPGSRFTGYGIVSVKGDQVEHVCHGVIQLKPTLVFHERLLLLHQELRRLLAGYTITSAAVEKIFFGKNVDSAFKLGHARGVCLLAVAEHGMVIAEYAARYVKKCITGSGAADKEHVQLMILRQLKIPAQKLAFDATDALSLAVTHARMREIHSRLAEL